MAMCIQPFPQCSKQYRAYSRRDSDRAAEYWTVTGAVPRSPAGQREATVQRSPRHRMFHGQAGRKGLSWPSIRQYRCCKTPTCLQSAPGGTETTERRYGSATLCVMESDYQPSRENNITSM